MAERPEGTQLSADEIAHYQKIVVALNETIHIMGEIDQVIEAHGGWPVAFQARTAHRSPNVAGPKVLA